MLLQDAIHCSVRGNAIVIEKTVYLETEAQRCNIRKIRVYALYKDKKAFMADLKSIYKAATDDFPLLAMKDLCSRRSA